MLAAGEDCVAQAPHQKPGRGGVGEALAAFPAWMVRVTAGALTGAPVFALLQATTSAFNRRKRKTVPHLNKREEEAFVFHNVCMRDFIILRYPFDFLHARCRV
jgi:hypothetical protein